MNDSSVVTDAIAYNAYGLIVSQTGPSQAPVIGWDGYQTFAAIDMDPAGKRIYNPDMERWMQQDPTGLEPDSNEYRYVQNDPTNATDPTGRWLTVNKDALPQWLSWLREQGLQPYAKPLPADHFWNLSNPYGIVVKNSANALVREKIAAAGSDEYGSYRTIMQALISQSTTQSLRLSSGWSSEWSSLDGEQVHEMEQLQAQVNDGQNYRRNDYNSGPSYVGAFAEGLGDGTIIVGNRLTSTFSLGQWTPLKEEAEKLIAENGGAYKWADASARIGSEAAFMLVLPPAVKGTFSGAARVAKVVPGVAQAGAKVAQAGTRLAEWGKGVLTIPYLGRTVMVSFKLTVKAAEVGAAGLQGKQMYDNLMEGVQRWQNGDTEGAVGAFGAAGVDGLALVNTLKEMAESLQPKAPNGLSSMSNMNRTAGRLYDQNRIDALRRYLDRNNVDLILNSTENRFVANSVGRHQLHLRPDPTFYEVYHELQHYRHLRGVGYASFSRTSEALREQYVYDQLRLSTNLWQNVLNQAERDNAFLYILLKNGNPMSTPVRGFP